MVFLNRSRIIDVFAGEEDGSMTFEDFCDMMSVFSEGASRDVKASYAFRIYDYDEDGFLDENDLTCVLKAMCGSAKSTRQANQAALSERDMDNVVKQVHTRCVLETVSDPCML